MAQRARVTEASTETTGEAHFSVAKAPTNIRGLDEILLGGLPRGRTTRIGGGAGTGKTVLALEFLYRGALAGESGIFITFEEQADAIRRGARAIGWDLAPLERSGKLLITHAELPTNLVQSGEFDIGGLLAILHGHVKAVGAKRLVIDAADVLLRLFRDPLRREEQLFALHSWLLERGLTVVLTVKATSNEVQALPGLEYMVDCVLQLDRRVLGQVATRRLRVLKYRGSDFLSNEHPYIITAGGIVLMPISRFEFAQLPTGPKFPSGIPEFDPLLDGGFNRGSCVLIGGSSGTGKTTFACSLAVAACERGERVLYVSFEESAPSLLHAMRSAGIDLRPAVDSQSLRIFAVMPEACGVEEHLLHIFQAIDVLQPQHVVVDAISACHRMGSEGAAFDFLVRLLARCKSAGITCLYLNQWDSGQSIHRIGGIGISSLVDALLVLEQDWSDASYRRRLLIIKARGSRHSHLYHVFQITDMGIQVGAAVSAALVLREDAR